MRRYVVGEHTVEIASSLNQVRVSIFQHPSDLSPVCSLGCTSLEQCELLLKALMAAGQQAFAGPPPVVARY